MVMTAAKERKIDFNIIILFISGILLSYPFFRKGLFFETHWLPYQIMVVFLALLALIFKKRQDKKISLELLDLTAVALVLVYFISIFAAVDVQGAFGEAFKVATYFIVYILISYLLNSKKDIETLLSIAYWGGITATVVSLAAAFGTINYSGAFDGGRLFSILQYPNTFAAYSIVLLIIGMYFENIAGRSHSKIAYAFSNYLCLVGFFGTGSRGGFITMAAVFLIYFTGLRGQKRIPLIIRTTIYSAAAYAFISIVFSQLPKHTPLYYWFMLLAFGGPVLLTPVLQISLVKINRINKTTMHFTGLLLAVSGLLALLALKGSLFVNRILTIGSALSGDSDRLVFYLDALEIIKDYPVFGTGGRGWKALYRAYQDFSYITTEVHNQYLQVWVETGSLGIIVYLSLWVAVIYTVFRLIKNETNNETKFFIWSIFCAALTLAVHSFLDFSLSIPAMAVLLWVLFGALRSLQGMSAVPGATGLRLTFNAELSKRFLIPMTGFFLIISIFLVVSYNAGRQGFAEMHGKNYLPAKKLLEKSVKTNPFASMFIAGLAEDLMFLGDAGNDPENLTKALNYINKAIKLEPFNPNYRLVKGKILLLSDKVEEGVAEFEYAVKLAPWHQNYVDRLAEIYYLTGQYYYTNEEKDKARIYFNKTVEYSNQIKSRINNLDSKYMRLQLPVYALKVSNKIENLTKMANEMLGKI